MEYQYFHCIEFRNSNIVNTTMNGSAGVLQIQQMFTGRQLFYFHSSFVLTERLLIAEPHTVPLHKVNSNDSWKWAPDEPDRHYNMKGFITKSVRRRHVKSVSVSCSRLNLMLSGEWHLVNLDWAPVSDVGTRKQRQHNYDGQQYRQRLQ